MNIIYVHGLDSSSQSNKALALVDYVNKHEPSMTVHHPDLNMPPPQVREKLLALVNELNPVVLVGSSLGGFFSTFISNATGTPAFLLNPSTEPHETLTRFFEGKPEKSPETVGMVTDGGWALKRKDLTWFAQHELTCVQYPKRLAVLLKTGDELLNFQTAETFYREQGVTDIIVQNGGDHRISDFEKQLPHLISWVKKMRSELAMSK